MTVVPTMEILATLLLAVVVLRAVWLATHPAVRHAALRPAHWSREVDRVLHSAQHRA